MRALFFISHINFLLTSITPIQKCIGQQWRTKFELYQKYIFYYVHTLPTAIHIGIQLYQYNSSMYTAANTFNRDIKKPIQFAQYLLWWIQLFFLVVFSLPIYLTNNKMTNAGRHFDFFTLSNIILCSSYVQLWEEYVKREKRRIGNRMK